MAATSRCKAVGAIRLIVRLVLLGTLGVLGTLAYYGFTLPVPHLLDPPTQPAVILEAADGAVFAGRGVLSGRRVSVADLPVHLLDAVIAIEDRRFRDHDGVDLRGIMRALSENVRAGGIRQGGSTITQQLAKVMFLGPERTIARKIQEAMIAVWLEGRLTKDEILSLYLDRVYFGAGAYGIDAAARRYFDKPAGALTLPESALLAGLIRAPSRLAPTRDPVAAQARAETVLSAMAETDAITRQEADTARAAPARLAPAAATDPGRNYFADWAYGEVRGVLGAVQGDFIVQTTLDPALQDLAQATVAHWLAAEGEARRFGQAALVALAPDGAVLAMVGGGDWRTSQFNRVTQARRPAGSLFKLFVYLAAFQSGMTPDSIFDDRPLRYGDWSPDNYDGRFRGPLNLSEAFARSINSIAVQLTDKVGPKRVIEAARRLGVEAAMEPDLAIALGTPSTTLLEMTAAYAAVAGGLSRVDPYGVSAISVVDKPLYRQAAIVEAAGPLPRAAEMRRLLREVVTNGTGRAAGLDRPVAGKTGTSQDHRDAWFIGYTDGLVVGVWVGNDDNSPTDKVTGGTVPARIWHDFVAAAQGATVVAAAPAAPAAVVAAVPDITPAPAPTPLPAPAPIPAPSQTVIGVPTVIDTATLDFDGDTIRLAGVVGEAGKVAGELKSYIGGREVACVPFAGAAHRCEVGGYDLSEVVLFNGGARATNDAPGDLKAAESRARAEGVGVWARR